MNNDLEMIIYTHVAMGCNIRNEEMRKRSRSGEKKTKKKRKSKKKKREKGSGKRKLEKVVKT